MQVKHALSTLLLFLVALFCATPSTKADSVSVFTISGGGYVNCADYISFTFQSCGPAEGFAGALEVDATTGTPIDMAGLIPGFGFFGSSWPAADYFAPPGVLGAILNGTCLFQSEAPIAEYLTLCFTTPTPGSLAGFDGGEIIGFPTIYSGLFDNSNYLYFLVARGSITPVATPEPSSLMLLLLGLVGPIRRSRMPRAR